MTDQTCNELLTKFRGHFGCDPELAAYAPGRIEVLGNHTDYNEGFVLSAATNMGTYFFATPVAGPEVRIVAGDIMEEVSFPVEAPTTFPEQPWANYLAGVLAGLIQLTSERSGFCGMFLSSIPLAAGLSSSAALEIATGLALCELYGIQLSRLDLAKVAQQAEHEFAGVRCGLLDQISSLFGRGGELVLTDFRSLSVITAPIGADTHFLVCNTGVKHTLVESEYNARRASCEEAARFFGTVLDHEVAALRDVTWEEWESFSGDSIASRCG